MSFIWVAISIVWVLTIVTSLLYSSKLFDNSFSALKWFYAYLILIIFWQVYRLVSREKVRRLPDFNYKFNTDMEFAKKFNNHEFIKTVTSYGLISFPLIYSSGIFDPIFLLLGVDKEEIGSVILKTIFTALFWIINTAIGGIIGNHAYKKYEKYLP